MYHSIITVVKNFFRGKLARLVNPVRIAIQLCRQQIVTATVSDATATHKLNVYDESATQVHGPETLTSGQANIDITLGVGPNTISIKVTAEDETTTKTYHSDHHQGTG
jgi:molybdopterin-binding protein